MHSTDNLEDGYVGSGKRLGYSIRKYGLENHKFEILEFLPSREELKKREAEVVNEELLSNPLCMNLKFGGEGGWDHTKNMDLSSRAKAVNNAKRANGTKQDVSNWISAGTASVAEKRKAGKIQGAWVGKHHSEETKQKLKKSKNAGNSNSQFGLRWIYNLEMKVSKKIQKDAVLPEGWEEGRKIKF